MFDTFGTTMVLDIQIRWS